MKRVYQVLLSAGAMLASLISNAATEARLNCIKDSYADYIEAVKHDPDSGQILFQMKNGARLIWSSGEPKTFQQKLDNPDLADMVSQTYPKGRDVMAQPDKNDDPGRFRNSEFFKSVYGENEAAVKQNLVDVIWPTHDGKKVTLKFNQQNGAAMALQAVADELQTLPTEQKKYLYPAFTFIWRVIEGTSSTSAHSYGIAIDINTKHSHYWRWTDPNNITAEHIAFINQIPASIVDIFERHGFIWGGRWYHYDTMHFEYRPELLHPGCLR